MELKTPKAKKKSNIAKLISWGKMFRTPLLILFLLGTTNCENDSDIDSSVTKVRHRHHIHTQPRVPPIFEENISSQQESSMPSDFETTKILNKNDVVVEIDPLKVSNIDPLVPQLEASNLFHINPSVSQIEASNLSPIMPNSSAVNKLSEIKYLRRHLNREVLNFVMTDVLVDGEVENRVHFNGITAKETYVGQNGNGLRLRQLTDGRHLVQLIYNQNGDLQDCEFITQQKSVRNFLKTLRKELKLALDEASYKLSADSMEKFEHAKFYRHFGNVSFKILNDGAGLPPGIASWLDYDKLKEDCVKRHEEMKYMAEKNNKVGQVTLARSRRSFRENFIVPGTKWCGAGQLAEEYNELGTDRKEDICCRTHDNCRVNIGHFRRRFGYFNYRPFTISHCRCDRRTKRDAMDILRVPGTKWCGKGFSATRYSQLGGYTRTDRCCRVHDLRCPFWIGGMEKKYGLYNWRVNTLMHCRCDERFRACLKLADTSVSNMVGKLFFNVVQTKCFILKPVKMCTQRSWWGKCLRRGYMKQAYLRDNLPY